VNFRFDQPELLLLALLAIPVALVGWRALNGFDWLRRWTVIVIRTAVIALAAVLLAGPRFMQAHDHLTVIGVLDVSGSVRRFADLPEIPDLGDRTNMEYLRWWFREATQTRTPDDRFGLIVFDGRAVAISAPRTGDYADDRLDATIVEGTNIAEAIRLGLAMFPADTSKRLVLVSDGNETTGDALAAAREAAGRLDADLESIDPARARGVPIDVAPVAYRVDRDVRIVRVEAPPNARPGQVVTVRMVVESVRPTEGWLSLEREGQPIDLNADEPGVRRALRLPAGRSVHLAQVTLGDARVNRFEAAFEPADPQADFLPENNRAEAFVATPGRGAVLLVRRDDDTGDTALESTLRAADIDVEAVIPEAVPIDPFALQSYDLVILQDVGAFEVSNAAQENLARYVHDFGGGLIMTGGESSFGAGGWNGTPVEEVLPLELDLPRELRLTQAALVLVMDKSGSMSQSVAGTRATQQEIANRGAAAAIESMQKESQVGVVVFDSFSSVVVPLGPNDTPRETANRVRGIAPGGGTNMAPALRQAYQMLQQSEARKKYVVCLSDGKSAAPGAIEAIAAEMHDAGITVSTIAVGDEADYALLERVATVGDGEFYPVLNPATLPRVLVDSVQVVNKPLIKEVTFRPVIRATGTTLAAGLANAPPLEGLVLTAHRGDPRVVTEMVTPEGEPLLAHWQAGLGRAAAFTSDAGAEWATQWVGWAGYASFWTRLVRSMSRSPVSSDFELSTELDAGRLDIALEAAGDEAGYLDYLVVEGKVYSPSGEEIDVRLRQTGPGRYGASVEAPESGTYIVALLPREDGEALAPVIGGVVQSEGAEFARYRSNVALLQRIAETTGGRLLDLEAPAETDLFSREGMAPSVSVLPAWRTFLWWLVALLLFDVAVRRLAWDASTIRRAAAAAARRVTPGRHKADAARGTLASLRARSEAFEQSIERESAGYEKLRAETRFRIPRARSSQPEATGDAARKQRIAEALDAVSGRGGGGGGRSGPASPDASPDSSASHQPAEASKPKESPPPGHEPEDEPPSETTTGGLLAAKRRLRQEQQQNDADADDA